MEETSIASQKVIFARLDELVQDGALFYPEQVVTELSMTGAIASGKPFPPYYWAKNNKQQACRHGQVFEALQQVLAHPQARRVLDPEKTHGADEADPHVLALALFLKMKGANVTVVTEDRRDKPFKLSVQSACGILQLWSMPVRPFLVELDLLPVVPPGNP